MSVLDIENLLQEVSPDAPCGENLEYDPVFVEMERAAQGKAEQQFGDTTIAAEEPNWKEVKKKALELFGRSKDLRAAVYLTRAVVHTDGFAGLCDGLGLLHGLLAQRWESMHPQLDPDDDNDPMLRVNAFATIGDREAMLLGIHNKAPLVSSRALGRFSLRDLKIAKGELSVAASDDGAPLPDQSTVDAAFMDCDLDELQVTENSVTQSIDHLNAIDTLLMELVGSSQAPNLDGLSDLLKEIHSVLAEQLSRRGVETESVAGEGEGADEVGSGSAKEKSISGTINSREDVVRMLDKACEYFTRNEPSSPVPLLLQRAKRLISMDFMAALRDLAPDGVSQIETIAGTERED